MNCIKKIFLFTGKFLKKSEVWLCLYIIKFEFFNDFLIGNKKKKIEKNYRKLIFYGCF